MLPNIQFFSDGVILRNEGSRARTWQETFARFFTAFRMTRDV